jgi:hypothetical protein
MYNVQDYSVFITPLLVLLYVREVCAYKTFIEVSVPSQESERSCICFRDIDFALSAIF